MNEIDEDAELYKVKVFIEAFALGSDKDGLAKAIGQLDKTRKALTAAKKREAVDVEGLCEALYVGLGLDKRLERVVINTVVKGHLTSSEKPTHSIPAAKGEGE
mgnify:CR=1 FL=1